MVDLSAQKKRPDNFGSIEEDSVEFIFQKGQNSIKIPNEYLLLPRTNISSPYNNYPSPFPKFNDQQIPKSTLNSSQIAIIIMEESDRQQLVNFFMRSNEIECLKVDLFDSCDTLITSFPISNYNKHTIHLKHPLTHFYCILSNPDRQVEQQMQVKATQQQSGNASLQFIKKFEEFSIAIQIQIMQPLQNVFRDENFIQEQNQLDKFVTHHLKKLQANVIKKLELEELKKPLGEKGKNAKLTSLRKLKSKINLTTFTKLPSGKEKIYPKRAEDLETTLKSLEKARYKITESEKSEESLQITSEIQTRSKKHNTLFAINPICHTELSCKEPNQNGEERQKHQNDDYYDQFLSALQSTSLEKAKLLKSKKARLARLSHSEVLALSTFTDIEKQKKALEVVRTMKGIYSQQNSPIKIEEQSLRGQKKPSPYLLLNSRAFVKRKVK